jgi:hypothetical protein
MITVSQTSNPEAKSNHQEKEQGQQAITNIQQMHLSECQRYQSP